MLPAGSLNQAMAGPVAHDALLVLAEAVEALEPTPRAASASTAASMSSTGKFRIVYSRACGPASGRPACAVAGDVQRQHAVLLGGLDPERLAVELARLVDVVDGEAAERLGVGEHVSLLSLVCVLIETGRGARTHRRRRGIVCTREHDRSTVLRCTTRSRAGRRARAAARQLAGTTLAMWDGAGWTTVGALPGGALRPPRPRRLAHAGRTLRDRRARRRRAGRCSTSSGSSARRTPASRSAAWSASGWRRMRPTGIDRLVALCTSAHLPPAEDWAERAAAVGGGGQHRGRGRCGRRPLADPRSSREARAETCVRGCGRCWSPVRPEGYAGCCRAIERMDLRADLGRITAPALVVAGEQDLSTPPEHGKRIAAGDRGRAARDPLTGGAYRRGGARRRRDPPDRRAPRGYVVTAAVLPSSRAAKAGRPARPARGAP